MADSDMHPGARVRQARLEAGLSQSALCGDALTRNMLSQIESGRASPSLQTLRFLAARLGKPVGYFFGEDAPSPNGACMSQARGAYARGDGAAVLRALAAYAAPDADFDAECALLQRAARLLMAKEALAQGKMPYAVQLLEQIPAIPCPYWGEEAERTRLLLLARAMPRSAQSLAAQLPSDDAALLLRAQAALEAGDSAACIRYLDAAQTQTGEWSALRGEALLAQGQYARAAEYLHRAEEVLPARVIPALERCYREMGDYRMAYLYAKKNQGAVE